MSGWMSHLVLGSTGLVLTVAATAFVLRAWRRLPVPSYRLAVAVLTAVLTLPAAQLVTHALGLPFQHPVRALVQALRPAPQAPTVSEPEQVLTTGSILVPGEESHAAPSRTLRIDPALLALALLGQDAEESERSALEPARADPGETPATRAIPWRTLLALAYLVGVVLALARTARRLLRTRGLLRSARPVQDERVCRVWDEVSEGSPLAGRVRLLESDEVRAPACFGLGRPAVVLPRDESLARRSDVLACVLTHELVHLERRDGWVLLGEELLRAAFWFHPSAWWLVARLERLREVSCDLLVVRRTGQRRRYAQALVEYAAWMTAGEQVLGGRAGQAATVVPWSTTKGQLTRRIEMLLSREAPTGGRARFLAPAAVGLVFTFLWSGQLALAAGSAQDAIAISQDECVHGKEHCSECGHHALATTVEAQGGVLVTTQGKDGQVALKAGELRLEPGQTVRILREGAEGEWVEASAQKNDAPIGITLGTADDTLAAQLGESAERVVVVRSVLPDSRAEKAGLQAHDVIVRVDGKGGTVQDMIEHAKQCLREGRDVEVVVVRKGDRKPMVLRAGDGKSAISRWVEVQGDEDGDPHVHELTLPKEKQWRLQAGGDGSGRARVFGLGRGDELDEEQRHEIQVLIEEMNGAVGIGGGAGGASRGGQKQWKAWTDADGRIHLETTVEAGHESEEKVFGLGQAGGQHTFMLKDGELVEIEPDRLGAVNVFRLGGKGGVVTRGKDGGRSLDLLFEGDETGPGETSLDLMLEDEDLGKDLRERFLDYYRQVDPEDFQKEVQKALEIYESRSKDFVPADELRKLHTFANKDAQQALEQARKALEGISDKELAERTRKALEQADLALEKGGYQLRTDGKAFELREKDTIEVPRTKIEALKEQLDATRQQLEAQRKQIEELKRALEKLGQARGGELR